MRDPSANTEKQFLYCDIAIKRKQKNQQQLSLFSIEMKNELKAERY